MALAYSKTTPSYFIDFNDTERAFSGKTDLDLKKSYWLFKLISHTWLVKVGQPITRIAFKIKLPIKTIIKRTIFKQFCGGESINACVPVINQLRQLRVGSILDYSIEGEKTESGFDQVCQEIIKSIQSIHQAADIPFAVFKPSGIGPFELLEKVSCGQELSASEASSYQRYVSRFNTICETAFQLSVRVLIDAEHSWIQDGIDCLALQMMQTYNKESVIVYNTYQLYLQGKLTGLEQDLAFAKENGFILGVKIVRGAYMEIERERASRLGYQSPIQPDKQHADMDFNKGVNLCLSEIAHLALVIGTHNEDSCQLAITQMHHKGIAKGDDRIFFSQLLGMSDHLTFNLSAAGFNVLKYMPYGPIQSVMPYLFRRAEENTSVAGQTSRELMLILAELDRRKKCSNST